MADPDPPIIPQLPGEGTYHVLDVLPGLDEREVMASLGGSVGPERLLAEARILVFGGDSYPHVDEETGHVLCPLDYLAEHSPLIVYLDMVHELVHTRQVLSGETVYHFPKRYYEWPTEIEAYRITYEEAQRLGLDDAWFIEYLAVPWLNTEGVTTLARSIGMKL